MTEHATSTGYEADYHDRQYAAPYESTTRFCDWLVELRALGPGPRRICDAGCGKGANLFYMARRFPSSEFVGVDIDAELVRSGNDLLAGRSAENARLVCGDLHKLGTHFEPGRFDGIVSLQTLSWLPGYEPALDAMTSLSPKWIAVSSLFYDGPIEARTVVSEFAPGEDKAKWALFYNTYSIPKVRSYLAAKGYGGFHHIRFDIAIDLPQPADARMQTYTERTESGKRLQISGPLLMNWYFVYATRVERNDG